VPTSAVPATTILMDTRVVGILDPRYTLRGVDDDDDDALRRSRKIDEVRLPLTNSFALACLANSPRIGSTLSAILDK